MSRSWTDRVESLVGRRRESWVIAGLLIAVLTVAVFVRTRPPAARIAPPSTAPVAEATPTATPSMSEVLVHVSGAVRRPGLYALPQGSRVADALEAAGGATERADVDAINLAEVLVDAAKVDVPRRGASGAVQPTGAAPSSTPTSAVVNVNTADALALETVPGIGPVLAAAIVQHREEHGPFPSVDALLEVSGIGPATLESVRLYVTV